MIRQIDGWKKPDIEMEDKMITTYDICSEYWHSDEFFDICFENTFFDKCDGEIMGLDLPKASFFEDSLINWAKSMDYEFNSKELIKEWNSYYDPNDSEMQDKLTEYYITQYYD